MALYLAWPWPQRCQPPYSALLSPSARTSYSIDKRIAPAVAAVITGFGMVHTLHGDRRADRRKVWATGACYRRLLDPMAPPGDGLSPARASTSSSRQSAERSAMNRISERHP